MKWRNKNLLSVSKNLMLSFENTWQFRELNAMPKTKKKWLGFEWKWVQTRCSSRWFNRVWYSIRWIYCGRRCNIIIVILTFGVLEHAVWFAATRRLRFPIALNFAACLFDNHMSIWTFWIQTLAHLPFWTHLLMTECGRLMTIWTTCTLQMN